MKTKVASKYALKFLTIGKNRAVFLLLVFLLTGCPSGGSDDMAPATPANPDAAAGDQRVTVTWDRTAGASSYRVYWSETSGTGTGGTPESVSAPPFYHDGVTNEQPYYYVVTAVNDAGESGASAEVTATPADILLSGLTDISTGIFTDARLSRCVDTWRTEKNITYVNELTSLTCEYSSIENITGIEALTSLTSLSLYSNDLTDVSALASLTNLTRLGLGVNSLTDVRALASLTRLTRLDLDNNEITDVSVLASLTSLTRLDLDSNSIGGQNVGNVDDLVSLVNATSIDLRFNIDMSCQELGALIDARGSVVVVFPDTATNGTNCTNP